MKTKPYGKWCAAFIQNLRNYMNLQGWRIVVEFCLHPKEDCEGCYACISSDSTYMQATLTIYPMAKADYDSGDLDHLSLVLTHELCHILIDPLHEQMIPFLSDTTRPFFTNTMENVTQRIALVVHKNLPKSLLPPR